MRQIILVSQTMNCTSFLNLRSDRYTAEEIRNAPTVIPLSMGATTLINGTLGFAMLLALLFCMPSDLDTILGSGTSYPFMKIFAYGVGSKAGATALVSHPRTPWKTTTPSNVGMLLKSPKGNNKSRRQLSWVNQYSTAETNTFHL